MTISPSGLPCLRSLACKSHSLASKRAVIGRPQDFDILLESYVKSHPTKAKGDAAAAKEGGSSQPKAESSPGTSSKAPEPESRKGSMAPQAPAAKAPQDQTQEIIPLVQPPKLSSKSMIYSWRLSSWLSEPLRLYSRSRLTSKGGPN